jgi:hypothetical protein
MKLVIEIYNKDEISDRDIIIKRKLVIEILMYEISTFP